LYKDFRVGLIKRLTVIVILQDNVEILTGLIFDFVLVRSHVTFKLRVCNLWLTNVVSYEESTGGHRQSRTGLRPICYFCGSSPVRRHFYLLLILLFIGDRIYFNYMYR